MNEQTGEGKKKTKRVREKVRCTTAENFGIRP